MRLHLLIKTIVVTLVGIIAITGFSFPAYAEEIPVGAREMTEQFYQGVVVKIIDEGELDLGDSTQFHQLIELTLKNAPTSSIIIDHGATFAISDSERVYLGEKVVVAKTNNSENPDENYYYITDKYRAPYLLFICIFFFALAILFGRKKGFMSIIGLIVSGLIIFYITIPLINAGYNALVSALVSSLLILLTSLYLSHGFTKRTTLALISTLISLGVAIGLDVMFVTLARLYGNASEEAFFLHFDNSAIDLRGLLLGGILIGVMGVLDDITTSQTAAVEEIYLANPARGFRALVSAGLSVGREHIASLVNTLFLAYVGASFPLLILYTSNDSIPVWVTLNSNFIAEEVVRTLVGSSVLIIAVPITTILAAAYYTRRLKLS